jgi:ATP synthase protein I
MSRPQLSPEEQQRQRIKAFARYGGLAFQLFGSVLAGVFIGKWLDQKLGNTKPVFAVFGAIFFLIAALWVVFRSILNEKK